MSYIYVLLSINIAKLICIISYMFIYIVLTKPLTCRTSGGSKCVAFLTRSSRNEKYLKKPRVSG